MGFSSINPASGELIETHAPTPPGAVAGILEDADRAFRDWRRRPFDGRAEVMHAASALLEERAPAFAHLMAREMGKPRVQGLAEVEKCAQVCVYYADNAERFLAPEPVDTDASISEVRFEPLGAVLAVMPWNFPFWQVFRFAAPTLMAGNAGLLKHAPNVPACAAEIEALLHDAGVPKELFRNLAIPEDAVPDVIASPYVKAVTLTGSARAGKAVAAAAGAALKPTVLELGGSDPYLILEDADLDVAVAACVTGRLQNSGQSCIAAKRWIVVEGMRAAFEERAVDAMRRQRMGDPLDEGTDVGPLAREDLRDELHRQVVSSVEAGATLLLGGEVPDQPGWWYPPTVLTDVAPGSPAYTEELFGPVAAIIPAIDEADAIRVANDTAFGLGAAVFTRDEERGRRIAATELQAGGCFVNTFARSDPRLPFGGIGASGYGRELAAYGIREFVNVKTVYVA